MAARNTGNPLRLYLLGGLFLFWCALICLRLFYLQVFRYGDFEQRAQHQQQRTIDVSAKRGNIYDRAGNELAMSVQVDSAFAVPSEMPDLPGTSRWSAASRAAMRALRWRTAGRIRPSAGSLEKPTPM